MVKNQTAEGLRRRLAVASGRSPQATRRGERKAEGVRRVFPGSRLSTLDSRLCRRGVLLLVVLSMLVLFMLIGTAFLMTSSQYRTAATGAAKADRVGTPADDLAYRGLMQVLRDTDDTASVVRYHSLLRDLYGTDGFEAEVYQPREVDGDLTPDQPSAEQATRFAGATAALPLGPTQGQFIDIYVKVLTFGENDPITTINEAQLVIPDTRHGIKLERDVNGGLQPHTFPLTKGYYNGCLLTMTSGPARGQSTRIVDYEFITVINSISGRVRTRLFRFRVMGFPRADGSPLQINPTYSPEIADLVVPPTASRTTGATILRGHTFVVNGRPFSGTGVGYNPMAAVGSPRLNAQERVHIGALDYDMEIALAPNSTYLFLSDPTPGVADVLGVLDPASVTPLNPKAVAAADRPLLWKYQSYVGPGDADESYDAADFQNMFLALQTVLPRSQGRVVQPDDGNTTDLDSLPDVLEVTHPRVMTSAGVFTNTDDFLRLDLEDLPLPSFHRPDLLNYWYHQLFQAPFLAGLDEDDRVRAILRPYDDDGITPLWNLSTQQAAQITAIKRKISLRPLREDHPNFDGSNPQSRPADLSSVSPLVLTVDDVSNIAIPYWEAVGPWDVDNDNDGVPDSVWVDLGEPVQAADDGTLYKPLYAFLIVDLDSRLNVNAHGLVDDIQPTDLAAIRNPSGNLVSGANLAGMTSSNLLSPGIGYGPAEISLRPLFPAPWSDEAGNLRPGNRLEDWNANGRQDVPWLDAPVDDYASLLAGRVKLGNNAGNNRLLDTGRYGLDALPGDDFSRPFSFDVTPGVTNVSPILGTIGLPDVLGQLGFFGYPFDLTWLSSFGNPPDMMGRYALGLDYTGQPVYEVATEPLRPLLSDSPYELDLSGEQRRDVRADRFALRYDPNQSATQYVDSTGTAVDVVGSLIPGFVDTSSPSLDVWPGLADQTDDAPFATAELERILRAFDADAGTLPSRLWNLVGAFDPLKLFDPTTLDSFDPFRVQSYAREMFGSAVDMYRDTDPAWRYRDHAPYMLTAAQQMSATSRRLVTTDSYDLPVPAGGMPSYVLELGPDLKPGIAGTDDDPDGNPDSTYPLTEDGVNDDPGEIGAPGSDDFQAITGTPFTQATIVDLLRYRIVVEFVRQGQITLADVRNNPVLEQRISAIINGGSWIDDDDDVHQEAGIIAPEVIAGWRMDLNRPFGDGKDGAGDGIDNDNDGLIDEPAEPGDAMLNGVVDEPSEAGDPFLDLNNNGKYDDGTLAPIEPFIDVDADGRYTPPCDRLWTELTLTGALTEEIGFDYTNGQGEPIHPAAAVGGIPATARVRNLESQGRQLFARQLYCLMLLLVDENYIAPVDGNDPQIVTWIEAEKKKLIDAGVLAAQADFIVKRKLTCRTIAQWAVNCADFRDADVIMTPFEYDENPWDGWGTLGRNGVLIPLDGDPATDENGDITKNEVGLIDWNAVRTNDGDKVISTSLPNVEAPESALNQTRGLVWGTERPELLITETLAFHDRRTEDLQAVDDRHNLITPSGGSSTTEPDVDLDQRLRPRGSMFVEVYNPWSPDGQKPAELYGTKIPGGETGVMLDRLSNAADSNNKRSPVWRMIVVEEWPEARNRDKADDLRTRGDLELQYPPGVTSVPKAYKDVEARLSQWTPSAGDPEVRPTNPDFDAAFDPDFKITYKRKVRQTNLTAKANEGFGRYRFNVWYPYIEREFYFTSDNSSLTAAQTGVSGTSFEKAIDAETAKVRIPDRAIRFQPRAGGQFVRRQTQKFIAKQTPGSTTDFTDVPIAPILPGRYGVIGSAGTKYTALSNSYTTTVGRANPLNQNNTKDIDFYPDRTRRIELIPNPDPTVQQILVTDNGGDPAPTSALNKHDALTQAIGRDNELIGTAGSVDNIYTSNRYQPAVAIPVDGMNISEPSWGWLTREYEMTEAEQGQNTSGPMFLFHPGPTHAKGEGEYITTGGGANSPREYNRPFDGPLSQEEAAEIHSAGPTPQIRNGTTPNYRTIHLQRLANPLLPWNPSPGEITDALGNDMHDPRLPINPYRTVDTSSVDLTAFNGTSSAESEMPSGSRSDEGKFRPWGTGRPAFLTAMLASDKQFWYFRSLERGAWAYLNPAAGTRPSRVPWRLEPPLPYLRKNPSSVIDDRHTTLEGDTRYHSPGSHHMPMILEHTLGFGNETFGQLYTQADAPIPAGAPKPYTLAGNNITSTYPWLAWNNRPFASAEEIMQVPAAPSALLSRQYNTIDVNATPPAPSPYGNDGQDGVTVGVAVTPFSASFPFGHLLNFFAVQATRTSVTGSGPAPAPHFYRILDYVEVPSRYVGTDTLLDPIVFNDVPGVVDTYGADILGPDDPRYAFQPPFNKVSRERDPGRVNLNTVVGQRKSGDPANGIPPQIWSEVYDGIMHRYRDGNRAGQLGHLGPAWRDVTLSRRGYAQFSAALDSNDQPISVDKPPVAINPNQYPDAFAMGLHRDFPTFFANPFRSPDAGDLVPLATMHRYGVDASWLRSHPWNRANDGRWGNANVDDDSNGIVDDAREAGFGDDQNNDDGDGAIPERQFLPFDPSSPDDTDRESMPLFSETTTVPSIDAYRNPYMMYQPISRLGNLVTTRSGVFAVWITVGYFEVEPAPDWNDLDVRERFGGTANDGDAATIAARALYDRVYPEGYTLGQEVGIETGDVKRPRAFFIIDRTQPVGFKPGEDLNVEDTIRVRRRID